MLSFPRISEGGMGIGVSNWRLAQAVSKLVGGKLHCIRLGEP